MGCNVIMMNANFNLTDIVCTTTNMHIQIYLCICTHNKYAQVKGLVKVQSAFEPKMHKVRLLRGTTIFHDATDDEQLHTF